MIEREYPKDIACVPQRCELNCVCVNENQPFLKTQNTITEIFKYVIVFCASKYGDAINIAARLESATKEVGEDILIGHETAKSVDFSLKLLKPIKVKGKSKPLAIYTI